MLKSDAIGSTLVGVLKQHGVSDWERDDQGRHYRLKFTDPTGHPRLYVYPRTASDHRAVKNAVADVRRILKHGFVRGGSHA